MGLDINSVRFLIEARQRGAVFGDVLTFGRQDLNVFPAKMVQVLEASGFPAELFKGDAQALHAEPCFLSLGAKHVYAMDVSNFEGASFIHDLNQPIGTDLRERFDVVFDGGTLEHVFNFPTALKNCMEMVKLHGRLFTHTVANNWCGHGFYQFSPELFYRAFSKENGYRVERMVAHVVGPYGRWYEVMDPEQIRSRVALRTCLPVMLLIEAQRVALEPVFARPPQQSDYTPRWQESGAPPAPGASAGPVYGAPRPRLARLFPGLARLLNVAKSGAGILWDQSLWNRKYFRPARKP